MSASNLREDEIRRVVRDETQGPKADPAIADPSPLGLAAFSLTTLLLSLFNAGLLPAAGETVVVPLALFYGGLTQFLAGMWEFRNKNTFGATAFSSFGAFWMTFGALETYYADQIPAAQLDPVLGWLLIGWGIFTTYMWIASFGVNIAVMLVFLFLAATFFVLGFGDVMGSDALGQIGGYLGIATAVIAWYASAAGVINTTLGRMVLPVGAVGAPRS